MKASLIVLALTVIVPPAVAGGEQPGAPAAEQLGQVHFETSCSPAVSAEFDRGTALLHSFEFSSAITAYKNVLAKNPACAAAYWGIALSYWGNPFGGQRPAANLQQGAEAVQKGRTTGSPTPRERAYLDAVATLFDKHETTPQRDRVLAYERAMDRVRRDHPQDLEATIFYALALNQTALPSDKTYAAQLKAAGILEPLYQKHPDHPGLAHYIIHAYDHPPLAEKALGAARRYAKIAPSAPHALHMPSHTFTRVGYWQESADTNRASEDEAVRQGAMGEALHAMDYQTYAFLQMARDRAAKDVIDRIQTVMTKFNPAVVAGAAPPMAAYFASTAMTARYALERGAWQEAAQLPVAEHGTPFTIAMAHFARALGAARSGGPAAGAKDVERLGALRDRLKESKDAYWEEQVDIQRRIAVAWITFAEGRRDEGLTLLRAAADAEDATDKSAVTPGPLAPARELLADMLLEAGRAGDALVEYEASMKKEPGRFRGAYGAARAAEASGNRAKARQYYSRVLEIAGSADSPRPELERARSFVRGSSEAR